MLKGGALSDDLCRVPPCPVCSMPNAAGRSVCCYCGARLSRLTTLTRGKGWAAWDESGVMLALARRRKAGWDISMSSSAKPRLALRPTDQAGVQSVLDGDSREIGTLISHPEGRGRDRVLLCDDTGACLLALRSDGPTGLHVVDGDGEVLAMASSPEALASDAPVANSEDPGRKEPKGKQEVVEEALDVLLLAPEAPLGRAGLLALMVGGLA